MVLLCSCGSPSARTLKFRFVLPSAAPGTYRVVEDPSLPLEYGRAYTLRAKNGSIAVPRGLVRGATQLEYFDVVGVVDASNRPLMDGSEPLQLSSFGFSLGGNASEPTWFFKFGEGGETRSGDGHLRNVAALAETTRSVRFNLVLPKGSQGKEIEAVEDPALPLDFRRVYEVRAEEGRARVPRGFLKGPGNGEPYGFEVVELREATGRVLERDVPDEPRWGRASVVLNAGGEPARDGSRRYFFRVEMPKKP